MHKHIRHAWPVVGLVCVLLAFNLSGTALAASCASPISLIDTTPYTQNFDTLANTGTGHTLSIAGWCMNETGTNANTLYNTGTGSGNGGDTYSFGAAASTERALGGLQSSSLVPTYGVSFVNNAGSAITDFQISYRGEQWRLGTTARADQLDFQYSLDATSLTTGIWTDVNSLDFVTPDQGTVGAKDGNAVNTTLTNTITGLSIPVGAEFSIRWIDFGASGADDGLAVDDFSITPVLAPPDTTPPTALTTPTNAETNVYVGTNIVVTFNESVTAPASAFLIECPTPGNTQAFSLSGGPTVFTLNPTTPLPGNVACTVTIDASQVADAASNLLDGDGNGTGGDNLVFAFTTIPDTVPPLVSITPADGAVGLSTNTNIVATFNEVVTAPASAFAIECPTPGNVQAFTLSGGPNIFTLNPDSSLPYATSCTVTIDATQVADESGNLLDGDGNGTGGDNEVIAFTTADLVRIRDIQGAGHISPLLSTVEVGVQDVPGIVTAKRSNGFYIQDPDLSGDTTGINSSEAIFVFTDTAGPGLVIRDSVTVGDAVLVSGTITEFRPGFPSGTPFCIVRLITDLTPGFSCARSDLSVTEIVHRNAQALVVTPWACTGTCTITPIVIGTGGRIPPNVTLNTESANIETGGTFNATTDGVDFYESMEGMRVTLTTGAQVVGPSSSFGSGTEVWVVGDNFANSNNTPTTRGGLLITQADYYNPERIRISTKVAPLAMGAPLPNLNVGASIDSAIEGIVDYSFINYEIISLSTSYTTTPSTITKEITPFVASGLTQLSIATFNVENLGGNASAPTFALRANVIVNNLLSPDILVLEEMQDNNGETAGGQTADVTFTKLINAIVTAGGPTYAYQQIDPAPGNIDGGAPDGNIRIGFLYRTDRPITFVSRTAGDFDDALAITCTAGVPTPNVNPGRIDPGNAAFTNSRKPTMGEFVFNGQTFFIIGNHWNSKGGDDPAFGSVQPPVESSRVQRNLQAIVVRDFVNSILACDPTANVVVAGDLNDFQFSPPVATLLGTTPALTVMNSQLDANERYSYIYQGTSQTLDHIVVSPNMLTQWGATYDSVHVNAEFYDQVSDHDPSLILLSVPFNAQEKPMPNLFTTSTPTLNWARLTWATSYTIQVDEVSTFATPTIYPSPSTSFTIPAPGLANGTYYWRVQGKDASNVAGALSATGVFVIDTTP